MSYKGQPAEPRSQVAVQTSNNNNEKYRFALWLFKTKKRKNADVLVSKILSKMKDWL